MEYFILKLLLINFYGVILGQWYSTYKTHIIVDTHFTFLQQLAKNFPLLFPISTTLNFEFVHRHL